MDNRFKKTLTLLNNLIEQLEANTGGEALKNKPATQPVQESKPAEKKEKVPEPQTKVKAEGKTEGKPEKEQKKEQKEQKEQKKEKKEQKKEQKKQEQGVEAAGGKKEEPKNENKKEKKNEKKTEEKTEGKNEKPEQKKEDAEATVEDFANIDIRIGEIVECWKHPQSEKLYCEKIKVCGQVREIASGLQQFVPMDEMKGPVIVMANLKPRPLAKFMSNGMVVCASNAEHTDVRIIRPVGENSERAYLEGHEELFKTAALLPVLNPKKKILEKCLEHFRTDGEGFITWKGIKMRTSGGYLKSEILNGNVS